MVNIRLFCTVDQTHGSLELHRANDKLMTGNRDPGIYQFITDGQKKRQCLRRPKEQPLLQISFKKKAVRKIGASAEALLQLLVFPIIPYDGMQAVRNMLHQIRDIHT